MKLTFKEFLLREDVVTTDQDELQLLAVRNQKMQIDKQSADKKRPLDAKEQLLQRKLGVDKKKELAMKQEEQRKANQAAQAAPATGTVGAGGTH